MRLFEWILALSSIGMLWHVIWSRRQPTGPAMKILPLLMVTCIVLHLIVEGERWQMAPFQDFFSQLPMEFEVQNKASIPVIKDQVRDIEFALGQMKKLDHAGDNLFAGKIAVDSEDRKRRDQALGKRGYMLNLGEAGHLNFTDLPLYSPLIGWVSPQAKRNHRIINKATVCFFNTSLKELPNRGCESSIREYPDVRFKKGGGDQYEYFFIRIT